MKRSKLFIIAMLVICIWNAYSEKTKFDTKIVEERYLVLNELLSGLRLPQIEIKEIGSLTGAQKDRDYGFKYSDLRERVLPSIIIDAYPDKAVIATRAVEIVKTVIKLHLLRKPNKQNGKQN